MNPGERAERAGVLMGGAAMQARSRRYSHPSSGTIGALLAIVLAVGVGCGEKTSLGDLEAPLLWWENSTGLCSAFVAIDGRRSVWTESGCEDAYDFERSGEVSVAVQAAITARFDALPMDPMASLSACGGRIHAFGRRREGQTEGWTVCGSPSDSGELAGLQDPFLSLAVAFREVR
jgi:hypothetical protein